VSAPRSERDRASDEESGQYAPDHYARRSAAAARTAWRASTPREMRAPRVDATSVTKSGMVGHPKSVRGECEPRRETQQAARE
jgi:hypothetical protein